MRAAPIILSLVFLGTSACHLHPQRGPHRPAPVFSAPRPGPPAHAPAHGHRRKHSTGTSAKLVFDNELDVHVVLGLDHHYYREGRYYRWVHGAWHASEWLDHGWVEIRKDRVPARLAQRYAPGRGRGRPGRWNHPANRRN